MGQGPGNDDGRAVARREPEAAEDAEPTVGSCSDGSSQGRVAVQGVPYLALGHAAPCVPYLRRPAR
eukprot:14936739-Alexandrium_andersonii.AAC.1